MYKYKQIDKKFSYATNTEKRANAINKNHMKYKEYFSNIYWKCTSYPCDIEAPVVW